MSIAAAGLSVLAATQAAAQSYPQRAIRLVVDRPAGVPHDILARAMADKLSAGLKQTIIVDNRVGAGGNLAAEFVARSAPDGTTLLVALDTTLTVNPTLYKNLSFNPQADLRPLAIMATSANMLVVHPSIPVNSVAEFVAYAKSESRELRAWRQRQSRPPHHGAVPHDGGVSGHTGPVSGKCAVGRRSGRRTDQGRLRGHGRRDRPCPRRAPEGPGRIVGRRRPVAPEIPTIAEAGYDFHRDTYFVLLAPAATPEPVAALIEREARSALQSPDLSSGFAAVNMDVVASSGVEAKARLEADTRLWAKVIEATGMRAD